MSDLVTLEERAMPWLPAANTVSGPVLNFYDIPLVGLFVQHGCSFLYQCIHGHLDDVNFWLYTPINEREKLKIEGSTGNDLIRAIQELRDGRRVTVAMASKEGIIMSEIFEVKDRVSDTVLIRRSIDAAKKRLNIIQRITVPV